MSMTAALFCSTLIAALIIVSFFDDDDWSVP